MLFRSYFDKSADDVYNDADVTKVATGVYVKELDKGNVLSYFTSVTDTGSNGFVGNGLQNVALDDDAQIVYVNQDGDKAGSDIGVNGFDKITGYANAAIVVSNGKIDAIIIESSNECDILTASKLTASGTLDETQNTITVTITNAGLTGSTSDYSVALKDATNTTDVAGVTPTITTLTDGTLTVTLGEDAAGTALTSGTYTLTVTKTADSSTTTYTISI